MKNVVESNSDDKHIIVDWAYNRVRQDMDFERYEDGWDWIYENIKEEKEGDGTYDDYLVIKESTFHKPCKTI